MILLSVVIGDAQTLALAYHNRNRQDIGLYIALINKFDVYWGDFVDMGQHKKTI